MSRPSGSSGGLVEDLSHLFVKNDRGEMVPYSSFMQLKKNPWLIRAAPR